MGRLALAAPLCLLLVLRGIPEAQVPTDGEDGISRFLRATPVFGKPPVTLTQDERDEALSWPITKVYLTSERLILNRTNPESSRTAALFYIIRVDDENWKNDFQFWMREISGAYWSEERPASPLLEDHRKSGLPPSLKIWERNEPEGGYLLNGVAGADLVLRYTRGTPALHSTEISYPLVRILWVGDRIGFVAEVGPAKTKDRKKSQ